jgi:hypothetical protein
MRCKLKAYILAVCILLSNVNLEAGYIRSSHRRTPSTIILQVMREHPESLKKWEGSRIYLRNETLYWMSDDVVWLSCHSDRPPVALANLGCDDEGWYLLCKEYDPPSGPNKEAEEHYNKARDALIRALEYSIGAGLAIEVPAAAVIAGYNAVKAWKEMGDEYCAGVEAEERGTYTPPEAKSSRDD